MWDDQIENLTTWLLHFLAMQAEKLGVCQGKADSVSRGGNFRGGEGGSGEAQTRQSIPLLGSSSILACFSKEFLCVYYFIIYDL